MNLTDFKIYIINSLAIGFSFTNIEDVLKIILLILSIIYTIQKVYKNFKDGR